MVRHCLSLTARLAAVAAVIALIAASVALAESVVVFSESFDDGNWSTNPQWTASPADPSLSIAGDHHTSAHYSLKVAANANSGAIRTGSGLITDTQQYTCTFNLFVESIPEEGIPLCIQGLSNDIVLIIFLLPNGRVQASEYTSTGWHNVNLPYPLTYGQWHSFRIVFDGAKYDIFLDGHTEADITLTKTYPGVPMQLVIGNFGMAHTGTFYMDDIVITAEIPPPPENPGRLYVQFCSDTSTGGLGTGSHYNTFPVDDYSYVSPEGQAAQVMAESWRDSIRDSLGNPVKLTWYMNCGSIYSGGLTTGPILPYELMMDYHGSEIARWGDEMAYHYHTWLWDGANWTQTAEFTPCLSDFEQTVAHFILDREFFPVSFRSGWNWMSNLWECYLDDWFPYRFEGKSPAGVWTPYHPSPTNWQAQGDLMGWESPHDYTPSQTAQKIESAFAAAYSGGDRVLCLWSHLKEADFATKIAEAHQYFVAAHSKYPYVEFEYLTARDCMLKWKNGADTTPPVISGAISDSGELRTAVISVNEPIYQKQPFVAQKKTDGTYTRLDCFAIDQTHWQVQYSLAETFSISAAVSDSFGNAAIKQFPAPFRMADVKVTTTGTTIDVRWETNLLSDSQLDCRLMPQQGITTIRDAGAVTSHHICVTGVQPGQVYKLDVASTSPGGERITSQSIYVLTDAAQPSVVDNSDPGFSLVGTWNTGNSAAGHYGPDYRWISTSPTGTLYADWTWTAPAAGPYRISVWWSQGTNRCTETTYSVMIGDSVYPKVVDQQANGGKWNEHGVYYLAEGQSVTVRLHNKSSAGNLVIADAASFEPAYTSLSEILLGRLIKDGSSIAFPPATVTAVFDGEFYIQEKSGVPGIKVIGSGVVEGGTVRVSGVLSTIDGQRVITNPWLQ